MLRNNTVPTVPAILAESDDDLDDNDAYPACLSTSLPLYSCPSLVDHTYANFRSNVLRFRDLNDSDISEEPIEPSGCIPIEKPIVINCDWRTKMNRELLFGRR